MYILLFKPNFRFKDLFTISFYCRHIGKFGIRAFSQSRYHHICHTLPGGIISEAHIPIYRHIDWRECFEQQGNTNIYAYKVKKKVNLEKLAKIEKQLVGSKYDFKGAASAEGHGLLKKKRNDKEIFCSEGETILYEAMGWINKVDNKNSRSPQEVLELILDTKIVYPKRIKVWDGSKKGDERLATNIFKNGYIN